MAHNSECTEGNRLHYASPAVIVVTVHNRGILCGSPDYPGTTDTDPEENLF